LDAHDVHDAREVALTRGPKARPFSEYAKVRGARDLLRMATELGMLSGLGPVKTFASIAMSDDVTMFYAHTIADLEGNPSKMPASKLWRLAYMSHPDVHVALLRLHQYKRLSNLKRSCVGIGPAFAAIGAGNRVDGEGDRRSRRNCAR
jgi:hypothetical protein